MNDIYDLVSKHGADGMRTRRRPWIPSAPSRGHRHDDREDASSEIGPPGRDVVLGRVDQRLDRDAHRLVAGQARAASASSGSSSRAAPPSPSPGSPPPPTARPWRRSRRAVPRPRADVVATEERHDDEPLHREREVRADHLGEPVRLALQGQPVARRASRSARARAGTGARSPRPGRPRPRSRSRRSRRRRTPSASSRPRSCSRRWRGGRPPSRCRPRTAGPGRWFPAATSTAPLSWSEDGSASGR